MSEGSQVDIKRGLKDVYLDTTLGTFIDGKAGKLLYRGYNIHDLAEKSTFEETTFLLLYGRLPSSSELDQIDTLLKQSRALPTEITDSIRLAKTAHPMEVLRTAVSALARFDPDAANSSSDAVIRKGIRLTAQTPTILAAHHRYRTGYELVTPDPNLSHAANFLFMLHGEKVSSDEARILDKDFILHADHGSNASAFAARVAASTQADFHGAITAAVATLQGVSHGGAAESVRKMTIDIGDESRVDDYISETIRRGERIMGFGHRVYKAQDPRAVHLKEDCYRLGEKKGDPTWFHILSRVAAAMEPYESKGIYPNVDFWSGAIYTLLGIPDDLFIPIFAMGRVPGWTLQVMEQYENNILIRPLLHYQGPKDLEYLPVEQRG